MNSCAFKRQPYNQCRPGHISSSLYHIGWTAGEKLFQPKHWEIAYHWHALEMTVYIHTQMISDTGALIRPHKPSVSFMKQIARRRCLPCSKHRRVYRVTRPLPKKRNKKPGQEWVFNNNNELLSCFPFPPSQRTTTPESCLRECWRPAVFPLRNLG